MMERYEWRNIIAIFEVKNITNQENSYELELECIELYDIFKYLISDFKILYS